MKTTVHVPDALLAEVQSLAAKENTTLKALISEGLQHVVASRKKRAPFRLKDGSFPPKGMVKEKVEPRPWEEIVSLAYGDRGG